jgi:hypothetical protein
MLMTDPRCPKCQNAVRKTRDVKKFPNGIVTRLSQNGCEFCNPEKFERLARRRKAEELSTAFALASFESSMHSGSEGRIDFDLEDAERLLSAYKRMRETLASIANRAVGEQGSRFQAVVVEAQETLEALGMLSKPDKSDDCKTTDANEANWSSDVYKPEVGK